MSSILTGMEAEHKEEAHQLNRSRMHTDTRNHQEMSTFVLCKKDQKSSNIRTDMYVNVDFTTVLNFPCEFKCIFSYYEGFVINESASVADLPPGFLVPPPPTSAGACCWVRVAKDGPMDGPMGVSENIIDSKVTKMHQNARGYRAVTR